MTRWTALFSSLLVAAVASMGLAQEPAGALPELTAATTLAEYCRYAALNNPGLHAAFNRWQAALEQIPQAKALPNPRLNYGYYIEEVETRVGPQRQRLGISQQLPWFGKRGLRADAATEAAQEARQRYEKEKLALFYRVEHAYYDYWFLGRSIALAREHVQLITQLERVARTGLKVGRTPHSAVVQAQVELGKLTDRLESLEALRTPTTAALNATLGRGTRLPLAQPRQLPPLVSDFSDSDALAWLRESNPDLALLEHRTAKESSAIALARRDRYPDVALGLDYIDTGPALNPALPDSGKDPLIATISISLPLWLGKQRATEEEARYRYAAAVETRADAEARLGAKLELALFHFRDAQRKLELYHHTLVPKAREALAVTRKSFEAGRAEFAALIDAQRSLLEFELTRERAQADLGQRLAQISMLVGRDVEGASPMDESSTVTDHANKGE